MYNRLPPALAATIMVLLLSPVPVQARAVVALLTDFGLSNEAVGQCHGAILKVDPDIAVVDFCHAVDSYDVQLAALMLRSSIGFPKDTVFVAVVDPGVGTERKAIAVRTKADYIFVGPNNGVLSYAFQDQGVSEAVEIDARRVNPDWEPGTFDGRDLFAPAGAMLAQKGRTLKDIGQTIGSDKLIRLDLPRAKYDAERNRIEGVFLRIDEPYGNLWTNIDREELTSAGLRLGDQLAVKVGTLEIDVPWVVSFGHVGKGEPLAYLNSNGALSLAINQGNFVKTHALLPGASVQIRRRVSEKN